MPGNMFQDVVSSRERAHRNWYTVPLSFLVHTAVLATLVVVPLVATDVVIPTPSTVLEYISHDFTPVVPAPPPVAPREAAPRVGPVQAGAPLVAPSGIGIESGVLFEPGTVATQSIDGLVAGLGAATDVVEAPPVMAPSPGVPVRTGGAIEPPARTRYVAPVYPEIARQSRVKGVVIIEAVIGTDGRVEHARVMRSHPLLDDAALAAVRAWEYTPTLLNGTPTPVIMTVTVRFDLN